MERIDGAMAGGPARANDYDAVAEAYTAVGAYSTPAAARPGGA